MRTAFFDCFSGISGDMFTGALLDAGLPFEKLKEILSAIPLSGYTIEAKKDHRNGIFGTRFHVLVDVHSQPHRNFNEIKNLLDRSSLDNHIKDMATGIFGELATVEGKIHDTPPEKVHFHEIGGVDSIIDIVAAAYGMDFFDIGKVFCSSLPLGYGFTESSHGRIPLPSPATVALLKDIPVTGSGLPCEMVTPTGAVLVKFFSDSFGPMPAMRIHSIGYGVGQRELPDRPNLFRILVGDDEVKDDLEEVTIIETNMDDTSPEMLGFLMDRLFEAGALDVGYIPMQMKKNRPGVQIQVISNPSHKDHLMNIIFNESPSLGIRFRTSQRKVLEREPTVIESPWGKIKAKKVIKPDGGSQILPEYEVCRAIALENSLPLKDIYSWILGKNRS